MLNAFLSGLAQCHNYYGMLNEMHVIITQKYCLNASGQSELFVFSFYDYNEFLRKVNDIDDL